MVDGCASNYDLILAVREGKLERTRELINTFGLSYSKEWSDGYVLLCEALKKKHMSIARLLLDYGCRVNCEISENATFDTPLHYAVVCGDEKIVKIVLDKGAWIDADTKSDSEQPEWNLNSPIWEVNFQTEFVSKGCTPLHTAVIFNQEGIVNLLIIYKADVNAQNKSGDTPLHIAAKKGNKKIVELLLENGATPDVRNKAGETALHRACDVRYSNCRTEVIAALLEFGFDINITCWNGRTPLGFLLHNSLRNLVRSDIEVAEYIVCHITKMKVANLYVRGKNLPIVNKIKKYLIREGYFDEGDFLNQCMRELEKMKDQKVCLCTISFYDILTKKANSLAMLMRNENLVTALKTTDYTIEFPLYATIIKNHFRKGMERKELLQLGHRSFNSLFNNLTDLPYDCTEKILRFLSNEDLKNLIDTFKSHCIN